MRPPLLRRPLLVASIAARTRRAEVHGQRPTDDDVAGLDGDGERARRRRRVVAVTPASACEEIGEMTGGLSDRTVAIAKMFTAHGLPEEIKRSLDADDYLRGIERGFAELISRLMAAAWPSAPGSATSCTRSGAG